MSNPIEKFIGSFIVAGTISPVVAYFLISKTALSKFPLIVFIIALGVSVLFLYWFWKQVGGKTVWIAGILGSLITLFVFWNILLVIGPSIIPPRDKDFPTVAGPENPSLINKASGYIVYESRGGLVAMSFPDKKLFPIPVSHSSYAVSGPDENGRIVYTIGSTIFGPNFPSNPDDYSESYSLILNSIRNNKEEIIFSRNGNIQNDIGYDLALSPSGSHVAFISNLQGQQLPTYYTQIGSLEIWDIATKKKLDVDIRVMDKGLSWFPDGERIAYTKIIGESEKIYIYDLRDKSDRYLRDGKDPVVSFDGKKILYLRDDSYYLMDLSTQAEKVINLPGIFPYGGEIGHFGFVEADLVVYKGLATQGTKPRWTTGNSPVVGPKPMVTIKIGDLTTGEFQTIVESIDPRWEMSYGRVKNTSK